MDRKENEGKIMDSLWYDLPIVMRDAIIEYLDDGGCYEGYSSALSYRGMEELAYA